MISSPNLISPMLPFPPLAWWVKVLSCHHTIFDLGEHFQKMSLRNRYVIGTSHNALTLSIPLSKGRDQRTPMHSVQISYAEDWQKKHWRSIESAYRRTPFFDYLEYKIQPLYTQPFQYLWQWNAESIKICSSILRLNFSQEISQEYIRSAKEYIDLRTKDCLKISAWQPYTQPFQEKQGFLPNLSILDILTCLGPAESMQYLLQHTNHISV